MESVRQGIKQSIAGIGKDKHHKDIAVSVNEMEISDGESESTTVASNQTSQDDVDTKSNLTITANNAATSKLTVVTKLHEYERLTKITRTVKKLIVRFDDYDDEFVNEMDIRGYLQYISDERLIHMPRRGSDWDRVLSTAQFFGLQITTFASKIETFASGAHSSVSAALASCQVLLEIGHNQAKALVPTFIAFYELAMLLSTVSRIPKLEYMPTSIKESAAHILCELVHLVGRIASHYKQKVDSLRVGEGITISFDAAFGQLIDSIWKAKEDLCDRVWRHSLDHKSFSISLKSVRQRLEPSSGSSVRNTLYDEVYEHLDRSEDTCHWIKDQLTSFLNSKDKSLNLWGEAGVGKSVLAEWVQERLARPFDYKSYTVLSYNFPWDSPKEATSLACVKSFVFQLLERSVGDVELYGRLVQAFEVYSKTSDAGRLETTLWDTLRTGIHSAERQGTSFILLSDGCDEMVGGSKSAVGFHKILSDCIADLSRTRVITFSRRLDGLKDCSKIFQIKQQQVQEDIRAHLKQALSTSRHYHDVHHRDREQVINDLVAKSKGNFLWAFYAGRLLVREQSCDGFLGKAKSISGDVNEVLRLAVDKLDLKQNEIARYLLSFMLVTNTPFSVPQIAELLSIDLQKRCMLPTASNISKFVSEKCGDFLIIRGGRIHFRNAVVQAYFKGLLGKSLLSEKEAHSQLTMRMLLYARLNLDDDQELLTDELDDSIVEIILGRHHLMGYVMRNWVLHFRHAGFVSSDGKISLPQGFRDIFPESVMFTLLERPCWGRHDIHQDTIELHELTLRIRESCFGEKHVSVLQSLVALGHIHVKFSTSSDAHSCGARYYYRAAKLGEVILSKTSTFVGSCTHLFLTWTETIVITKRTEIVTCREEMIRFWIEICKHKHGRSSDEVICWYEKLAKLYISIHEEWRATVIYRELHEIIIIRFGKKSPEAGRIAAFFGTLDIVLNKGDDGDGPIGDMEKFIFETTEELDIHSHLCIAMMIKLAWSYHSCGKFYLAERLFISIWRRISITCRLNASIEVHIAKIQIAIEYCKYLREVHRHEEATTILICLWAEYEHHKCETETLVFWIRELGTVCRSFGLLEITISILTKVWSWFKGCGKGDDEEARKTTILITEVVEEVTETTVTTKTTTTTTTEVTETVVKEIYETHYNRCKKSGFDHAFYSACMALIGIYFEHHRWSEAEVIIKRTLEITWKAILTTDVTVTLTEHSVRECVHVARRLARCYHHQGHFEKAEFIYLRIYRACLASCSLEDELLCGSITVLIEFYEEHHRHEKVIEIYIEILERYKKNLGHTHRLTIWTLYQLAHHCKLIGHKDVYKYYLEIVTVLNKGIKHCHHDAFEAALFLCRHYHGRSMWVELRELCAFVWETVCHHRGEHKWSEEIICEIYEKYTYVLEVHVKVEFSVLYKISIEYKEVIEKTCGGESHAYILALIAFAKMCEKHEKHVHESVTVYEEVIKRITTTKTTTTTVTETTINTVKKRLSKLYVTIITSGGKKEGHAHVPIDRAIQICIETYEHLKITLGCWHEETLRQLEYVIMLYHSCNTKEYHLKMVKLLEIHITEVITTCKVTATLFKVAITMASIYVKVSLVQQGYEVLRQLRHLIIFRGTIPCNDLTIKLDVHMSKLVFVFLSAFEHGLCPNDCSTTYSEIMATIIYESILYEEYSRVIECQTELEVVLECGAKLRGFWVEHKRTQLLLILDKRLFQLFKTKYASYFKDVADEHLRVFYLAILHELGKDRGATQIDFTLLAVKAGSARVKELLQAKDWHCAEELGHCVFHFAQSQKLYHRQDCVQYGYKLAEFLAGIDVPHPNDAKDEKIRNAMLKTSREIMTEVLTAFKQSNIDYLCLRFEDISGLIRLLGAQQNWDELELLLHCLWSARERLKRAGWSSTAVLDIGKKLVHAQYARKDVICAIETAELISYNLRRSRGRLDVETLEFSRLLAALYADSGRKASAMSIHETILREMISCSSGNEFGEAYPDRQRFTTEARTHLELLKASHHQLQGWAKPADEYKEVHSRLNSSLGLDLPAFDKWSSGAVDKNIEGGGKYVAPREWKLNGGVKTSVPHRRISRERPHGRLDVLHTARQWWLRWSHEASKHASHVAETVSRSSPNTSTGPISVDLYESVASASPDMMSETLPEATFSPDNFLALTVRHSTHAFYRGQQARAVEYYTSSAQQTVISLASQGIPRLEVVQSICLLVLVDIAACKPGRAWMTIGTLSRLEALRKISQPALAESSPDREASLGCHWTVFLLEQTFTPLERSSNHDDNEAKYPTSAPIPPSLPPVADGEYPPDLFSDDPSEDLGITAYYIKILGIWGHLSTYLHQIRTGKAENAWSPGSMHYILCAQLYEYDSKTPHIHLLRSVHFTKRHSHDLNERREYWIPWVLQQVTSHATTAILNHPFVHLVAMRKRLQGLPPRQFLQQTVDLTLYHSAWVFKFLRFCEDNDVGIYDPLVGNLVAVVATIPWLFQRAIDQKIAHKAKDDFAWCKNFLETLSTTWPHIRHKVIWTPSQRTIHSRPALKAYQSSSIRMFFGRWSIPKLVR
ncbi:hypothetical protein EDB82DRAFT_428505 [Fusarium venenatum]|uniref:uncharacterized protein n=1 Tax=Fusarium venenatum TaxID=56646 RepID=UPI001D6867B3|nr:hypothetical protein EDB82DRAFT_428505 [Fusarium venenatum]